jgi:hypothetical protein
MRHQAQMMQKPFYGHSRFSSIKHFASLHPFAVNGDTGKEYWNFKEWNKSVHALRRVDTLNWYSVTCGNKY